MLYIIFSTQSKYRNIQLPNFLFKKKFYRHKAEECWKREPREEVCINKEVLLTSKMSQESQSLQKLG